MTHLIKRNDVLADVLRYWNHNNPSNIGIGRLSRKVNDEGIYIINKTGGRQNLALFNINTVVTINGEIVGSGKEHDQLSLEPYGMSRSYKEQGEAVKLYISTWIESNKGELYIQLHFLDWFSRVEIKDLTVEQVIEVLQSYVYNKEEAEKLFNKLFK